MADTERLAPVVLVTQMNGVLLDALRMRECPIVRQLSMGISILIQVSPVWQVLH
jgi:hypothetical protein